MASLFGHAFLAFTVSKISPGLKSSTKLLLLAVFCSVIPDADVIAFRFDIPYESFWGHRGFSHSLLFALLLAFLVVTLGYRNLLFSKMGIYLILFFFICTASHGVLDAMTDGGRGVAFLSPWDNERYFFSWRPIRVSPIGVDRFFSGRGLEVIISELKWVFAPCVLLLIGRYAFSKLKK